MGMTGADGFPCCSKDSVDIVETQIDLSQHQLRPSQEELHPRQEELQPAQDEVQPTQDELQPAQDEVQPAQNKLQPSQEDLQPAQDERQPSKEKLQSSQEKLHPSQEKLPPSQEKLPPSQEKLHPSQEKLHPSQEKLQPSQEELQPAQEESQPAQEELQPEQEELQPAQEELQPAQDNGKEKEDELPDLTLPPKEDLEKATKLKQEPEAVESGPQLDNGPAPEAKRDSRLKSLQALKRRLTQQNTQQWNVRSGSIKKSSITDEEQVDSTHRSIFVQTSKHLFWADKDIQTSEHTLPVETMQRDKKSVGETASPLQSVPELVPIKQVQDASSQPELSEPATQQPSSTQLLSSGLTPVMSLQDLVNFASSLAIASSHGDLPNLEQMMRPPSLKAVEPLTVPMVERTSLPAKEEPEQEKLSDFQERLSKKSLETGEPEESAKQEEKSLEAGEPEEPAKLEDKTLPPCSDFSKPEPKRTAFKGKVKFIRAPARSSSLDGDRKDSVPGTKKENPLVLKIHFKLLPSSTPRDMAKQDQ